MRQTVTLVPRGPYALRESQKFLCGFTPAAGGARACGDALETAFLLDGSYTPAAVRVTQPSPETVRVEVFGAADPERAARQLARQLSLDGDATDLRTVAARDPVVARLLAERPGFRPVCFPSPYEAAVWGVLAQRCPMPLAAAVKRSLAERHGTPVRAPGGVFHTLPAPDRLLDLPSVPGVPEEKMRRLHAIAAAARDGLLDAERLRALPPARALAELRALRGVGVWTAEHVLHRGAGSRDALPESEPRVLRAARAHYGARVDEAGLSAIAEAWRPVRMWVCVLLVSSIAGRAEWHGPEKRGARVQRARAPVARALLR